MIGEISLVPSSRFGAVLSAQRRKTQRGLADIASSSYGSYTVRDLQMYERGRCQLDNETVSKLIELYDLDINKAIPQRKELVVDFNLRTIESADHSMELKDGDTNEILSRYLSLVYIMREETPGKTLVFRDNDISTLSSVLGITPVSVETFLNEIIKNNYQEVSRWSKIFKNKLAVPGAGLLVAVTSVGSLVLVSAPSAAAQSGTGSTESFSTHGSGKSNIVDTAQTAAKAAAGDLYSAPVDEIAEVQESAVVQEVTEVSVSVPVEKIEEQKILSDHNHNHGDHVDRAVLSGVEQVDLGLVEAAESYQETGRKAEALISYDWKSKLPGWKVNYSGDKANYRGMTLKSSKTIEIYINDGDSPAEVAGILAHEIGHALDVTYLDDSTRLEWLDAREMPAVWWAGEGLDDFSVGAGDFAEAVASIWVGSPNDSNHGEFTPEQLDLAKQILSTI